MNKNGILYTILFSFLSSFILVLPLALANEATKDKVAENRQVAANKAILTALGIGFDPADPKSVLDRFKELEVLTPAGSDKTYYRGTVDGKNRIAGTFAGPALWGTVTLAIGFDTDLSRFSGVTVLNQAETPGLGGRIEEAWFLRQFADQSIPENGVLLFNSVGTGKGDPDKADADVDGVTGATLTNNGFRDIVNTAIKEMRGLLGPGGVL